jgi:hypothetical protein
MIKKEVNKMQDVSRREFLTLTGIVLANAMYNYKLPTNENKIYELTKHVYTVDYMADTENGQKTAKGMGFILDGKYITCDHIPSSLKESVHQTPFGLVRKICDIENEQAYLENIKLTELYRNQEEDIAIYDAYGYLPDFPCKPNTNINLGDKVYIIGNPGLRGYNVREAKISDHNGVNDLEMSKYCFGIDKPLIPGDSGTPTVNQDYQLIGMNTMTVFNQLGYITKIKHVLKHL